MDVNTIIFVLQHPWIHFYNDLKKKDGTAYGTVFEVRIKENDEKLENAISLLNIQVIKKISSYLLSYMYDNEDRINQAEYVEGTMMLKKGMRYPPGMAMIQGITLNAEGKISDLGMLSQVFYMGPNSLRFMTKEPFGIGEITFDDIRLSEIRICADRSKLPSGVIIAHIKFCA